MLVEYASSPLAVDTRTPRFSWEVPLGGRSRRQNAYHILVASSRELLQPGMADLWDSGKVTSSQSLNVPYAGADLASNTDYYWCVRVWDEAGAPTNFSAPQYFGTALFDQSDWQAHWIGMGRPDEFMPDHRALEERVEKIWHHRKPGDDLPKQRYHVNPIPEEISDMEPDLRSPMMRTTFSLTSPACRARAFVCGVGLFELRLNGKVVGEEVLATPRSDFAERLLYSTYDITEQLVQGENAVGILLGNGWYNTQKQFWRWQSPWYGSPRALVQLQVQMADGCEVIVGSDESWHGTWSPITFNCIYDGENYDARFEQDGWDSAGFAPSAWQAVNVVPSPGGVLVPATHEAQKVIETVAPVARHEPKPGVFVFDMGKNMTGWVRLTVVGAAAGGEIGLRYGENMRDDGGLDNQTSITARQADHYIAKGGGEECYEPRFTCHGFRYVEITGYPGSPAMESVQGRFVCNGVRQTGHFECGNELINRIHNCTVQTQRCNLQMGVITDCPQRAERLGYGGDAWQMATEAYYNFFMPRFFSKWIGDYRDQQDRFGIVGLRAPSAYPREDLVWATAFIMIPWLQYVHCGDRRILEDNYPALKRYVAYLKATGRKSIQPLSGKELRKSLSYGSAPEERMASEEEQGPFQVTLFGDWEGTFEGGGAAEGFQPLSIATAFYYYDVATMSRIAGVLGKQADERYYRVQAAAIRDAFNDRFLLADWGYYDNGCQGAQAWPLCFGVVPEASVEKIRNFLCTTVGKSQRHLTTGFAGTRFAIQALSEAGRNDIVWDCATSTTYPSWGYMLRDPQRTTIPEHWDGGGSHCHAVFGAAIDEWFYWGLAGIRPDESAPGYERIVFKPYMPAELPWARASLSTPRGTISSAWSHDGATAEWEVIVPANCTARLEFPSSNTEAITESGTSVVLEGESPVLEIGSGSYRFAFPVEVQQ